MAAKNRRMDLESLHHHAGRDFRLPRAGHSNVCDPAALRASHRILSRLPHLFLRAAIGAAGSAALAATSHPAGARVAFHFRISIVPEEPR